MTKFVKELVYAKRLRFQWELKILTEAMVEGSDEYMEQIIWLNNKYRKEA